MAREKSQLFSTNKAALYFDWSTFLIMVLLIAVGLISIYSATYIYRSSFDSGMSSTFTHQAISGVIGIVFIFIVLFIPERWIQVNSYIVYFIALILLVLVLFIGKTTAGTKGWLSFAGFTIQPAEIAKLSTLLIIAQHLARKGTDIRTLRDLAIVTAMVLLPFTLIALQPDFGSATVLLALEIGILFWAGFDSFILYFIICLPIIILMAFINQTLLIISMILFSSLALLFRRKVLITGTIIIIFIAIGSASPILYHSLKKYQQDRIATFINPDKDPRGKGYNVIQSKMAVGSGGFAGKGFMQGTQTQLRYIPKQWTDFIFSVPTEEFGFIGGVAVILLLASLMMKAIRIANSVDSVFATIVSVGIATIWFYHSVINIGMSIGFMPVMGIPLPFMSAGGTSLLVNMAMVGLLLNFYRNKRLLR